MILFIDDNKIEAARLKILFDITENKLEKDLTYFNIYSFKNNSEYDKINKDIRKNDIGCHSMCLVIDKFINKKFEYGLNIIDDNK